MPAARPRPPRRSARLKALQTPFRKERFSMDQMSGPVTRGRGGKSRDKVSICAIIAKHVFEDDGDYTDHYANAPDKFRDSTNNHIQALKKKYRECHDRLHATGAGVVPQDEHAPQNLRAQVLKEFPWY
ncbi:uncharacterized protein F5147DRAFT_776234 [Suillus discolor]|uniref:Uncharacterized protein n=1 Tax=Suillus discolor TaxID=1912936 RepID=A0A9P7F363_9AGAM|nr:uncharacterized protein F5147DRAFT_776234 [Suillus discolor]KAG2102880.1 hypothetical protein F5147DRAFT_776234 [Suillus discolor]